MAVRFFDEATGEWQRVEVQRRLPTVEDHLRRSGLLRAEDHLRRFDPLVRYSALRRVEEMERLARRVRDFGRLTGPYGR